MWGERTRQNCQHVPWWWPPQLIEQCFRLLMVLPNVIRSIWRSSDQKTPCGCVWTRGFALTWLIYPIAHVCDELQLVSAVSNTPSFPPWERLHTQPCQCWFSLSIHLSHHMFLVFPLESILLCHKVLFLNLRHTIRQERKLERRDASESYNVSVLMFSSPHPLY